MAQEPDDYRLDIKSRVKTFEALANNSSSTTTNRLSENKNNNVNVKSPPVSPMPPPLPPRQSVSVPQSPLSSNNLKVSDHVTKNPPVVPPRPRAKTNDDAIFQKKLISTPPPVPPYPNTSSQLLPQSRIQPTKKYQPPLPPTKPPSPPPRRPSSFKSTSSKPYSTTANNNNMYVRLYKIIPPRSRPASHSTAIYLLWLRSKLPRSTLAQIWSDADRERTGTLDQQSFVTAMNKISAERKRLRKE